MSRRAAVLPVGSLPAHCPKRKLHGRGTRNARRRKSKQRHLKEETLYLCGWLLLFTSLSANAWSDEQVLALYRARWQVELVIKRMKQVLKLAQLRGQTAGTNEATILAVLLAWALLQEEVQHARQVLTEAAEQWSLSLYAASGSSPLAAGKLPTVSSWSVTALGVQTLRLLVQGCWTFARLRSCLPDRAAAFSAAAGANATIRRALSVVSSSSIWGRRISTLLLSSLVPVLKLTPMGIGPTPLFSGEYLHGVLSRRGFGACICIRSRVMTTWRY